MVVIPILPSSHLSFFIIIFIVDSLSSFLLLMDQTIDLKLMQRVHGVIGADFTPYLAPPKKQLSKPNQQQTLIDLTPELDHEQQEGSNTGGNNNTYAIIQLSGEDSSRNSLTLYYEDIQRLELPTNPIGKNMTKYYMNDNLAEAAVHFILTDPDVCPADKRSEVCFFSPLFFSKLTAEEERSPQDDYSRVARWNRADCISNKKFLFFPIVGEGHWSLIVFYRPSYIVRVSYLHTHL